MELELETVQVNKGLFLKGLGLATLATDIDVATLSSLTLGAANDLGTTV